MKEIIIALILLVIILLMFHPVKELISPFFRPYPEKGQIWMKCYGDEEDPFAQPNCDTLRVLAVQDGYVQFQEKNWPGKHSKGVYSFRFKAHYVGLTPNRKPVLSCLARCRGIKEVVKGRFAP